MISGLAGRLKNISLINTAGRKILRMLSYKFPNWVETSITYKWRIKGEVELQVNDLKIRYYSKADDGVADALYYAAEKYEEYHELVLFSKLSSKANVILDIGANTGIFSIISALSNKKAAIYSFEPYKINADRFRYNISLNQISTITIVPCAAGDENKIISFTVPEDDRICDVLSANESFTKKFYKNQVKYKSQEVEQVSIDTYLEKQQISNPELIKIDVESYEIPVFKGMSETLKRCSPVIICEIFVEAERDQFYSKFMTDAGYYIYMILPSGIIRISNLIHNKDCRNFIFSRKKTTEEYISFKEMDRICNELF